MPLSHFKLPIGFKPNDEAIFPLIHLSVTLTHTLGDLLRDLSTVVVIPWEGWSKEGRERERDRERETGGGRGGRKEEGAGVFSALDRSRSDPLSIPFHLICSSSWEKCFFPRGILESSWTRISGRTLGQEVFDYYYRGYFQ